MRFFNVHAGLAGLVLSLAAVGAPAADAAKGWSASAGLASFVAPVFPGSADYQWLVVPAFEVRYADVFFASVDRGLTYAAWRGGGWEAGPRLRLDFGRDADGGNPFRVAGGDEAALRGFEEVDPTLQAGGFVARTWGTWEARLELLQGVNGHRGLTLDLGVSRRFVLASGRSGPRLMLATGPRLRWADRDYHEAYFGVSPAASAATGLPTYAPGAGLTSAGWSASLVRPVSPRWTLVGVLGVDGLTGPAAASPLVRERGRRLQAAAGLIASARF